MKRLLHILLSLLGTCCLAGTVPSEARAGGGDPARLYDQVKQTFVEQKYGEALALVADIKGDSTPPLLQETEAMILERLWQKARRYYNVGKYDLAFAAVLEMERYTNPPELALAKAIISFYRGDFETAAEVILSGRLADSADGQTIAGFVNFECKDDRAAMEAWQRALSLNEDRRLAGLGLSMLDFVKGREGWNKGFLGYRDALTEMPVNISGRRTGRTLVRMEEVERGVPGVPRAVTPGPSELELIITCRNGIYRNHEAILIEAGTVTLDSVRVELRGRSFDPRYGVEFHVLKGTQTKGGVRKGSRELTAGIMKETHTYRDVRLAGLVIGRNVLVVSVIDDQGRRFEASVDLLRREPVYQKLAVLIGVGEYPWDPQWQRGYVLKDLSSMKDVLSKHGYLVKTILDPKTEDLDKILRRLRSSGSPVTVDSGEGVVIGDHDDLILYFTGHGFRMNPDAKNEYGLIVPHRARYDELQDRPYEEDCVEMGRLVNSLALSAARHKLLIMDTCYAALAKVSKSTPPSPGGCDQDFLDADGFYLMTASNRDEKSWMYKHMRQSAFTKRLVEALEGKAAGRDRGCITLHDIAGYITRNLRDQSPVFRFLSEENGMPYFEDLNG